MRVRKIIRLFAGLADSAGQGTPRRKASDYAAVLVGVAVIAAMQGGNVVADGALLAGVAAPSELAQVTEQQLLDSPVSEIASAATATSEELSPQPPQTQATPVTPEPTAQATIPTVSPAASPTPESPRATPSTRSSRPAIRSTATVTERFIDAHGEEARLSMAETGVPASVTLAQAILESNSGQSQLSLKAQNYFGIKARGEEGPAGVVYMDTWEHLGGRDVVQREPFRAYHNAAESFADHGKYLRANARYAKAFTQTADARQFARLIHAAGYATDPDYSAKLIKLMDKYDLYQYNR